MKQIPIETSARHVHLTQEDWAALFGDVEIAADRPVSQHPQFVAKQRVGIRGLKGAFENVAIVGPLRPYTQCEVSMTDAYFLGIAPPLSDSGKLDGAATVTIVGPKGEVTRAAAIVQQRHLHLNPSEASESGLHDHQTIAVNIPGPRGVRLDNVLVRVHPDYVCRLQLDTDEGNACGVTPGMIAEVAS